MTQERKPQKGLRIAALVSVITILGLLWLQFGGALRRNNDAGKIFATGAIEATEVDVSAEIGGSIVALTVDEGDRVERGKLIARLDTSQLEADVLRAEAALATARSNVRDLEAGAREQELEQARARVESTRAKMALDESDWQRAISLYEQGIISANQRDAALANRDVSRSQYQAAIQELRLLEAGARPDRIQAARAEMRQAEAALKLARVRMEKAEIYSPLSGTVLIKAVEQGEVIAPGVPIFTVADLDDMWVKIYIDEIDIGKIKVGQEALVFVDAFPAREFQGRISYVSDKAEFTPKNIQTREDRVKLVFAVKVKIDNAGGLLKPGMYADIELDSLSPDAQEQAFTEVGERSPDGE